MTATARRPGRTAPRRRGRGRRPVPGPDPDRHDATTGTTPGRGRPRPPSTSQPAAEVGLDPERITCESARARRRGGPDRGQDRSRGAPADPRPPRRRAGADAATGRTPVRRRDRRRRAYRCLGPRRGRHEGHGRDDARGRPRVVARRAPAPARHRARLPRRRGGRRHGSARTGSSSTGRTCSRASPRRSARSAASPSPSATTCGST